MKNPWKRLSKINPQREDGTRQINSKVLDALVKAKLSTTEMSMVLTVISKTWGFNKNSDAISISQFVESTGFTHRALQKASAALQKKRIIVIQCSKRVNRGTPLNEYFFNKHYDTWKTQDTKRVNKRTRGEQPRQKRVNKRTPTIETITIENISKTNIADSDESAPKEFYLTKKKRKLSGKRLISFDMFWDAFDLKQGKAAAADSWLEIPTLTNSILDKILSAAKIEAAGRQKIINRGSTPKWAQGWVTERRWEDEIYHSSNTTTSIEKETQEDIDKEVAEAMK